MKFKGKLYRSDRRKEVLSNETLSVKSHLEYHFKRNLSTTYSLDICLYYSISLQTYEAI